jgi:hypothetical protein
VVSTTNTPQFGQVQLPHGEVVQDDGDHAAYTPEDLIPTGVAKGMEKYLTPGFNQTKHKLPLPPRIEKARL